MNGEMTKEFIDKIQQSFRSFNIDKDKLNPEEQKELGVILEKIKNKTTEMEDRHRLSELIAKQIGVT